MATGIEELIDLLFTMIDEAKGVPLSGDKCVIERDKALDILDDIKDRLPVELAEARKIVNARNDYVAAAKREGDEIRRRAENDARQMVDTDQLVSMARQQAAEVVRQAEIKSRELRRSANEYCEDLLRRAEEAMEEAYNEARHARSAFRTKAGNLPSGGGEPAPKNSRIFDVEAEG